MIIEDLDELDSTVDNQGADSLDTGNSSDKPSVDSSDGEQPSLLESIEEQFPSSEEEDVLQTGDAALKEGEEGKKPDDDEDAEEDGEKKLADDEADKADADADKTDEPDTSDEKDDQPAEQKTGLWKKLSDSGDFDERDLRRLGRVNLSTRRKIGEIIEERDAGRASTETVTTFNNYLSKNRIDSDALNQALTIASAWQKGDLEGFRNAIAPMVQFADEYLGKAIPDDLAAKVQEGHMTEEVARDFARERHTRAMTERTAQVAQESTQAQSQAIAVEATANAVNAWEQKTRLEDPDFKQKLPMVQELIKAKMPTFATMSPNQVVAECGNIYKMVSSNMRTAQPAKKATQPVPNASAPSAGATAQPQTMFDAALAGLARGSS